MHALLESGPGVPWPDHAGPQPEDLPSLLHTFTPDGIFWTAITLLVLLVALTEVRAARHMRHK